MRSIVNLGLSLVLGVVLILSLPEFSMAQQDGPTVDEVVKRIKKQQNVRVLSAERMTVKGKPMIRVKVLDQKNGRVKYIWVKAGG